MENINSRVQKIDLVLQGPVYDYTLDIVNSYLNLDFVENVILSTWEGQEINIPLSARIKTVYNKPPQNPGITNRNFQIISSLGGLKAVNTAFTAKLRSDQIISLPSMQLMYDYYANNMDRILTFKDNDQKPFNRICVAGIFRPYPLHPRDHIFWGNTEDLLDVFSLPLDPISSTGVDHVDYTEQVRTEAYIAMHYCAKFTSEIDEMIENPKHYIVDKAPYINKALAISENILTKILQPFPKIDFAWPKHGMTSYHYHLTETIEGEFFGN